MPEDLLDELSRSLGSRQEARWVLESLDGLDEDRRARAARDIVRRRGAGEPLQYLLGRWQFRGLELAVDHRALIPRPETEALVGLALGALAKRGGGVVVDLGCGSGAIALSIAVESRERGYDVSVHATDVSAQALSLARENARSVGAHAVAFHEGSWFEALPGALRGAIDVLCANPPYVARSERPGLARELDFEPELALSADDAEGTPGLAAVATVISGAPAWLAPGGTVLVEHGEGQRRGALAAARAAGLVDAQDHDDLSGRPRILVARRP